MRRMVPLAIVAVLAAIALSTFAFVRPLAEAGENFQDSSAGASAAWFSEDGEDGFTEVFVDARQFKVKMPPGPGFVGSEVFVGIFRGDKMTGEFSEAFGFAPLDPDQFHVDRKLSEAALTAVVEVCEFIFEPPPDGEPPDGPGEPPNGPGEPPKGEPPNGEPPNGEPPEPSECFDVTIDLAWMGSGPLAKSHGSFHFKSDGVIENERFRDSFREAELTGSIMGDTIDLTGDSAEFADIHSSRFGGVFIGGEPFFP